MRSLLFVFGFARIDERCQVFCISWFSGSGIGEIFFLYAEFGICGVSGTGLDERMNGKI
jgi:hypothetical protein